MIPQRYGGRLSYLSDPRLGDIPSYLTARELTGTHFFITNHKSNSIRAKASSDGSWPSISSPPPFVKFGLFPGSNAPYLYDLKFFAL